MDKAQYKNVYVFVEQREGVIQFEPHVLDNAFSSLNKEKALSKTWGSNC